MIILMQICCLPLFVCLFNTQEFDYKLIIVDDTAESDLLSSFDECVDFIRSGAEKGYATLVHCAAGISRSATICIAYLIKQQGMGADEALEYVRSRRPIVCPNAGFREQLLRYADAQHQQPQKQKTRKPKCTLL